MTDSTDPNPTPRRRRSLTRPIGLIALALVAWFTIARLDPPLPTQERTGVSMSEMLDDIKWIAAEPRPTGSPANRAVRERLVERFRSAGWTVEIQSAKPVVGNQRIPFEVHNIVATLPGESQKGVVVLAAHYDSVARGPGAGDDGAAVAALLQVARVLPNSQRRRNDIVVLLTDGEEAGPFGGLLGARIFAAEHPLAKRRPLVVNFEARGTSGPAVMFETSPGNAWIVERYAACAWHPVTSSLAGEVYRLMPNKTDLSIFIPAGFPALNFAFVGSYADYHAKTDDVAHLDPRSLGHHAANAIAMATCFCEEDLSAAYESQQDVIYFDVLALFVIRYPLWLAWIFAAASLAMAGVVMTRAQRAFGGYTLAISLISLFATLATMFAAAMIFVSFGLTRPMHAHADWIILAFAVVAIGISTIPLVFRSLPTQSLSAAAVAVWVVLTIATTVFVPGASFLFAWPVMGMAGRWLLHGASPAASPYLGAISWLVSAAPIVVVVPTYYLGFLGGTLGAAPVAALPVVLLAWVVYPQMHFIRSVERSS